MIFVGKEGLFLVCIVLNLVVLKLRRDVYGNLWVVYVEKEKWFVDDLVERNGFINRGEIVGFSGYYLFEYKIFGRCCFWWDVVEYIGNFLCEFYVKFVL